MVVRQSLVIRYTSCKKILMEVKVEGYSLVLQMILLLKTKVIIIKLFAKTHLVNNALSQLM